MKTIATFLILTAASAHADEGKPISLNLDYEVFTRESIVEHQGKKFRKIEYKKDIYYLQLLAAESTNTDLALLCEKEGVQSFNAQLPSQSKLAVKVTKRSSFFLEGLKQACVDQGRGKKVVLDPALRIGFIFDEGDEKSLLKNKAIYITPGVPMLGFHAEW